MEDLGGGEGCTAVEVTSVATVAVPGGSRVNRSFVWVE
jgi:hypothetical protein